MYVVNRHNIIQVQKRVELAMQSSKFKIVFFLEYLGTDTDNYLEYVILLAVLIFRYVQPAPCPKQAPDLRAPKLLRTLACWEEILEGLEELRAPEVATTKRQNVLCTTGAFI